MRSTTGSSAAWRAGCLASVLLVACAGSAEPSGAGTESPAEAPRPASPAPPAQSAEPPTEPSASLCLPIVSGCGCAYQCASTVRVREDGIHEVVHDFLDSALVEATVERRCFDAAGVSYPETSAPAEATRCMDVFSDGSACGGECIPTTDYLDCRFVEGHCARAP